MTTANDALVKLLAGFYDGLHPAEDDDEATETAGEASRFLESPSGRVLTIAYQMDIERECFAKVREELTLHEKRGANMDALKASLDTCTRERDEAQKNYRFMVEHAADEKLDGYRELGAMVAKAEEERDLARASNKRIVLAAERLCEVLDLTWFHTAPDDDVKKGDRHPWAAELRMVIEEAKS